MQNLRGSLQKRLCSVEIHNHALRNMVISTLSDDRRRMLANHVAMIRQMNASHVYVIVKLS